LQSSDERGARPGKPSLLTPAQQAEADRNRILTKLEHGRADVAGAKGSRNRILAWGGVSVAAVALLTGGGLWLFGERTAEVPHQVSYAVTPAPAVAPSSPSPAGVDAGASAAVIHDEVPGAVTPVVALAAPAQPVAATAAGGPLDAAPAPKPGPADLKAALENGSVDAKSKPARLAGSPTRPSGKTRPSTESRRHAVAAEQQDSDVALLSALVAHTHAGRAAEEPAPPPAPKPRTRSVKDELKSCGKLKSKKARQCRVEACSGHHKSDPSCKALEKPARPAGR
jgi:hypothetical protein